MKYIGVLIVCALLIGGGVWLLKRPTTTAITGGPDLPPPATTLAGPQEPAAQAAKPTSTSLSKHRLIVKNGMNIEVIKEGTGEAIKEGQTATVDYTGKFVDGRVFDASSSHGQPFSFTLGAGQVIKGWDQGVVGMKVGETRILTIPPELGYGPQGYPPIIPANAMLVFEVTLVAIK